MTSTNGGVDIDANFPHRPPGQQLVSGTTSGSFGFQIELPPPRRPKESTGKPATPLKERSR